MQPDLAKELQEQRQMIAEIYTSVEKTRKYFLWTMWGTVIVFVLPLIAVIAIIPWFLNSYTSELGGTTGTSGTTALMTGLGL